MMKRTCRSLSALVLFYGVLVSAAPTSAEVIPTTLEIAPASSLTLWFLGPSQVGSAAATLVGGAAAAIDRDFQSPFGVVPVGLGVDSLTATMSDLSIKVDFGLFAGSVDFGTFGLSLATAWPLASAAPIGPDAAVADVAGATLALNGGTITYHGAGIIGSDFGTGTFDFAVSPLNFEMPVGSTVMILQEQHPTDPGKYNVTVSVPINVAEPLLDHPLLSDVQLVGEIVLTGMKIVPEPGALVLLGLGAIGFLAAAARRFRRG